MAVLVDMDAIKEARDPFVAVNELMASEVPDLLPEWSRVAVRIAQVLEMLDLAYSYARQKDHGFLVEAVKWYGDTLADGETCPHCALTLLGGWLMIAYAKGYDKSADALQRLYDNTIAASLRVLH